MLRIGEFKLDSPFILAPMAGITDAPFRRLCKKFGAGMTVSEMTTADISLWKTTKSKNRLNLDMNIEPRVVQIAGSEPKFLSIAAQLCVEKGAQIIDINMGCPAKKVCNKAAGSALMQNEKLVEDIIKAGKLAMLDQFVNTLPDGYMTVIGERGVKLSGGQRQRIAIARAVLANPKILILDEATSNLDTESEALIQESLSTLMKGRTTFVIAHRLSTIRKADQILVIEEGEILEKGNHEELINLKGRYHELFTYQARI